MKDRRIVFTRIVLALTFLVLGRLAGQDTKPTSTNHHLLWKVEGKSNVVYLMGSIHVLKPENYPLPAALENAYSNSQVAVFEADIDAMSGMGSMMTMLNKFRLPEGETLQKHLSPETYASFVQHANDLGVPMMILESLKPGIAEMFLELSELTKLGADPEKGLDKYFNGKARSDGKEVIGLETADFQLDLVLSLTGADEDAEVKTSLDDLDKAEKEFGEMLKSWETGDAAALEKLLNDSLKKTPSLYKRMITDRNKSWMPRIVQWLNGKDNVLVVVGSAHLVGDEGVVEMLKKKGFKVTQE